MLDNTLQSKISLHTARLYLKEGLIEEGKTKLWITGTGDECQNFSSLPCWKQKGFSLFMTRTCQKGELALPTGLDICWTMEFWGIDGIIFMCLMEFEDRLKIELDCFSSGQLCRKEKYIKARRQGKKRVQQLTSCLSTLWRNEDNWISQVTSI